METPDLVSESLSLEPELIQPEPVMSKNAHYESDELLQAELTRVRQQAEQKGFAQGELRGLEEGKARGYEEGLKQGRNEGLEQGLADARAEQDQSVERFNQLFSDFKSAPTAWIA